jgi:hypothetical protein
MSSAKPIIFISYAHADEPEKPRGEEVQWLTFVMRFLRPAVKSGAFTMWVDRQMPGGTEWDEEIEPRTARMRRVRLARFRQLDGIRLHHRQGT